MGCHGIPKYYNVYPTYRVPKLGGQSAEYIAAALNEYKSGNRAHGTMHAQAASLSDQDIAHIAAFLATPPKHPSRSNHEAVDCIFPYFVPVLRLAGPRHRRFRARVAPPPGKRRALSPPAPDSAPPADTPNRNKT